MSSATFYFSPCPNDTFIMYAIVHEKISLSGFQFEFHLADIEELNLKAIYGSPDIIKVSAALYNEIRDNYTMLVAGAAFGLTGGPMLVAKPGKLLSNESLVALPGKHTTAGSLFRRYYSHYRNIKYSQFSEILAEILCGYADAGVIIHEDRFIFKEKGLKCINDLGLQWINETGLPVPLGMFVVKNSFDRERINALNVLLIQSIKYARLHYDEVFPWVEKHAQNKNPDIIKKHIEYYVNNFSLNLEAEGIRAVEMLNE